MRSFPLPNTTLRSAVIGLGTAGFGTAVDADDAFALMDRYVEAGGNHLDSAHVYAAWEPGGWGASERTVGAWLADRGTRDEVLLATKGAHHDLATHQPRLTREAIAADLAESLDRLGTDRIDLYWLHRDDPAVPVADILGWLGEHIDAGVISAIGCSNWTAARQRQAAEAARSAGRTGFCASQVRWSYADFRLPPGDGGSGMLAMDADMLAFHRETGIPVVAYAAQAGGFFSGRYGPGADPAAEGVRRRVVTCYGREGNYRRLAAAESLAASGGLTANRVALAWLLHRPVAVCALVGCRTVRQLDDTLAAAELRLSQAELAALPPGPP